MSKRYYFGYGSNLNKDYWGNWCKKEGYSPHQIQPVGTAWLPDHALVFNYRSGRWKGGVLNIKPQVGCAVSGMIFEVSGNGWLALDKKEGCPGCYERYPTVAIAMHSGKEIPVMTYRVPEDGCKKFVSPSQEYLNIVLLGRESLGLPLKEVEDANENKPADFVTDAIFVYGTLLRGESRFPILQKYGLECTLLARTFGKLLDLGSYPGLVQVDKANTMVEGEFIRVRQPHNLIQELDVIEGFTGFGRTGSLFRRNLMEVDVGDGRIRLAWVYVLACGADTASEIKSGDWREHKGVKRNVIQRLITKHTGGNDRRIAEALADRIPFNMARKHADAVTSLLPLEDAILRGELSERRLAQTSGFWVVVP